MPSSQSPEELREAFELFSQTSERLADAYADLQGQVARLSAELADANGELARRERLSVLGEVAARLAHQLRTPLAAALLYVGHLARPDLAESDRLRFADKTLGRLRYLERLIQDMLAFVKGQQGQRSTVDVVELLDELHQVIEPHALTAGVRLAFAPVTSGLSLDVDRQALLGALINLAENAIHASHPGQTVAVAAVSGGAVVRFSVEDQGAGIDDVTRERLFEPFFTTRQEGSGLGLAIVKQAADAQGGWIELESTPGQGSRFLLYMPRQPEGGDR